MFIIKGHSIGNPSITIYWAGSKWSYEINHAKLYRKTAKAQRALHNVVAVNETESHIIEVTVEVKPTGKELGRYPELEEKVKFASLVIDEAIAKLEEAKQAIEESVPSENQPVYGDADLYYKYYQGCAKVDGGLQILRRIQ